MTWGIWVERFAYNPGHEQPELRCWLLDSGTRERSQTVRTFDCIIDAVQYAAVWRANECKHAESSYEGEPKYGIVQARRYDPIATSEHIACEPQLAGLTGWFGA